ncbi:hypothetical protein F2P81_008960 [Scophthalmus maximus]|uniref:Uncharacterized protein n=1 Tax=Scophthalmus maximus TaxID=52904 RepID=A0A6A4STC9_SCOMX|nr:hypothetical protein F2P81_008960 [Scophthalmus maximus]
MCVYKGRNSGCDRMQLPEALYAAKVQIDFPDFRSSKVSANGSRSGLSDMIKRLTKRTFTLMNLMKLQLFRVDCDHPVLDCGFGRCGGTLIMHVEKARRFPILQVKNINTQTGERTTYEAVFISTSDKDDKNQVKWNQAVKLVYAAQ